MQGSKFLLAYFNKRIGRILHFRGPHEIRVFGLDVSITHFCHILLAKATHKAWSRGKMWRHRCQLFVGSTVKWHCRLCGQMEGRRTGPSLQSIDHMLSSKFSAEVRNPDLYIWNLLSFKYYQLIYNFQDSGGSTLCGPNTSSLSWMWFVGRLKPLGK